MVKDPPVGTVRGAVAVNVRTPGVVVLNAEVIEPSSVAVGAEKSDASPTVVMAPEPSWRVIVHVIGSPDRIDVADDPARVGEHASVDAEVGVPIMVSPTAPLVKSAPPARFPRIVKT